MRESLLKLRERTVILAGPPSATVQAIASAFVEHGADVALVDERAEELKRFTNNLNDMREVHSEYGRATTISLKIEDLTTARDAISRVAETFGSIDVFIDAHFVNQGRLFQSIEQTSELDSLYNDSLKKTLLLTHEVLPFLEGRNKGRIIHLVKSSELLGVHNDSLDSAFRSGLCSFVKGLSEEIKSKNITANCLAIGITEDYLLARFPQAQSVESARAEFEKIKPGTRIVSSSDIAQIVAFLASPLGGTITGQTIRADHGL